MRVFQTDHDNGLEPMDHERRTLAAAGVELVSGSCTSQHELIERAADADVLWVAWRPHIDRSVLESLPRVGLVIRWGVGFDQIDVGAATDMGVAVANSPTYGTTDVAEHVIALLLSGARRIAWYHEEMRAGGWPAAARGQHRRVTGRTLGLIGVGRIGSAVARRASALGIEVIGYDPARSAEELAERGIRAVDIEELLAAADYISLHVPLTASTHHFVDAALLRRVKPGAALINASRGKVVDTDSLVDAVRGGHLAWAALDVYEDEPLPPGSALRECPNVVLTPHVAAYSEEAWQDLRDEMCLTTLQWLQDGWAERIVNPEVRAHLRADPRTRRPIREER